MATELYQLRVSGRHGLEYNECVFYYIGENLAAGDVIVNAKDLLTQWVATLQPLWLDLFPSTYQLDRLTAKRQDVAGGVDVVTQYQAGAVLGSISGEANSNQLCPIIRWIPPMGTKSAGRNFLPCIAESDIDNNIVTAGWLANVDAFGDAAIAGFGAAGITWTQAVYSRKLNLYHKAQDFDTSPIVGWQKRRQRPY
jgi:hypothetical protein